MTVIFIYLLNNSMREINICGRYLEAQTGGDRARWNLKLLAGVVLYMKDETERKVKAKSIDQWKASVLLVSVTYPFHLPTASVPVQPLACVKLLGSPLISIVRIQFYCSCHMVSFDVQPGHWKPKQPMRDGAQIYDSVTWPALTNRPIMDQWWLEFDSLRPCVTPLIIN